MSIDREQRTAQLRQLLVEGATTATREKKRPWRLVSLVAAIALASGVTGALSAAAITQSGPYPDETIIELALSVARPKSVALGQPHYLAASTTTTVEVGAQPAGATGLAIKLQCTEPGTIGLTVDDTLMGSTTCDEQNPVGGGGSVSPVSSTPTHSITFASSGTDFKAWIVWVEVPPLPASSPQQDSEMADGVVTREEYVAAFNRFVGCLGGAGYNLVGVDTDEVIFNYSIPSEAVSSGAEELCYEGQFSDVDMTWQIQNENSSETARLFRECLTAAGIPPADNFPDLYAQITDSGILDSCLKGE